MSHFPKVRKFLASSGWDRHYLMPIHIRVKTGIKKMFLTEVAVPGAKLKFANVKYNNVSTLKRWLSCRNLKFP